MYKPEEFSYIEIKTDHWLYSTDGQIITSDILIRKDWKVLVDLITKITNKPHVYVNRKDIMNPFRTI